MAALGILFFCLQAVFLNVVYSQSLPCNGKPNSIPGMPNLGICNNGPSLLGNIGKVAEAPMTITSATFTPINNALATQAGLPVATVTEVVPNLQYGDVTLTGDLPIGGTIKVSGCFPVYGVVGIDGIVPSIGTAAVPQNTKTCVC